MSFLIVFLLFTENTYSVKVSSDGAKGRDKVNQSQTNSLYDLADILGTQVGDEVVEAEKGNQNDETASETDNDEEDKEEDEEDDEEAGKGVPGRHCLNNEWVRTKELLARDEEVCKKIMEEAIDEYKNCKSIDLKER
jgi:hypothetical protein